MKLSFINKKYLGIFTAVLIAFTPLASAYADGSNVLTYDEAIKIALRNNRNLTKLNDQLDNLDKQLTTPSGAPPFILQVQPSLSAQLTQKSVKLNNASKTVKLNFETLTDALELSIKGSFYKIDILKDSIAMKEKKLLDAQDKHRILSLKFRNGMASKFEVEQSEIGMKQLNEDISAEKLSLEKEFENLKSTLGTRVFNYTDVEELPVEYTLVDELHIKPEYQAAKAVTDSPAIFAQQKAIEEAELGVVLTPLFIMGAGTDAGITPVNIQKSEIKLKDTELRNAKDELYFTVVGTYNNIKSIENNIAQLEVQLDTLNKNIDAMKARLDAGVVSKRDLDNLLIMKEELVVGLDSLRASHTMLLMQYQKPHLLGLSS
ncbi:TolC family protein [Acetoanaerobium noterae]|uniref:TolC family protein n=1 Tax=Acetoanaerobium noterae TaxID=745369 RepID=UPI003241BC48